MLLYYTNLILFLLSLFILIYFTYRSKGKYKIVLKTITSLLFVSIGIISHLYSQGDFYYFMLIIAALIFSLLGDIFLALKISNNNRLNSNFLYGLISFSIAHLMYVFAFIFLSSFSILDPVIAFVLAFLTIIILKSNNSIDFKNMLMPVCIYSFVILMMGLESFKLALLTSINGTASYFLLVGALLFIISDIILAFILFYKKSSKILPGVNLITYYIGQLFLASTLLFL